MKRLATFVFALLLAGTLSFAQAGGGTTKTDTKSSDKTADSGKKAKKAKKAHKGGKKSKKGDKGGDTTATPK